MQQHVVTGTGHTWHTTLQTAARHWRAGEHARSLKLQTTALECADCDQNSWALLWSCMQLGVCRALLGQVDPARQVLERAGKVAVTLGEPVVAGICATTEALCAMFPDRLDLPKAAQRSLCSLHHGLIQYLQLNRLPLAEVCWQIELRQAALQEPPQNQTDLRCLAESDLGRGIQITFLGGFNISVAAALLTNLPIGRGGALLKYLLVNHDQLVHGDVLLELFWPGVDPQVSRNRFHYTMHCLRRTLAAATGGAACLQITYSEGRYGFMLDRPIWIDSEAFTQFVATGKQAEQLQQSARAATAYCEALALYQGEFLPEDCYDDWTGEIRAHLAEAYLDTLDRLSRLSLTQGNHTASLEYCCRLLALDNCREDIHQRLMHCYMALGQRANALRQYQRCTQALQNELGLRPLPETTRLYQKIRDHADALAVGVPLQ